MPTEGFKPPLPEEEQPPAEEQFALTMQKRLGHSAEIFSDARVPYSVETIDALARDEVPWLNEFTTARGLDEDTRTQLSQILAEHVLHVNEVHLAEFRGAHSPKDTARFDKIERSRLFRALILLLDSDGAAELQLLMERHLPAQGASEE